MVKGDFLNLFGKNGFIVFILCDITKRRMWMSLFQIIEHKDQREVEQLHKKYIENNVRKIFYSLFISLLPIFIIVICGYVEQKINAITSKSYTAKYIMVWIMAFYSLFGISISVLYSSKMVKKNIYVYLTGFVFIVILMLYWLIYPKFQMLLDIMIFNYTLYSVIDLKNLLILFGVYLYKNIMMCYTIIKNRQIPER